MSRPLFPGAAGRWGIFEITLRAEISGADVFDTPLRARFRYKNRTLEVPGFYDGEGMFRVRFMPDTEGAWEFETLSVHKELDGARGAFTCTPPAPEVHGPVRVAGERRFAYADGAAYLPFGTTLYAWTHQNEALENQTLETLSASAFNKVRMCVFPKHYLYNENEPPRHVYERKEDGSLDFGRFNTLYFQHLEKRISQLAALGIEADLVLMHPYDKWGYAAMTREQDERYLRYLIARLAAHRNIWWSLANEYDLMEAKTTADWDNMFKLIQSEDPHNHLRSIHNCRGFYDHGKPWVDHCSIQHADLSRVNEWGDLYRKPVVVDECRYEGDIHRGWGNISAQEMTHRFWTGFTRGGYVGHGETYVHPEDLLWWSKGGTLHGGSPKRIAFLRRILEDAPVSELRCVELGNEWYTIGVTGKYLLSYLGLAQPRFHHLNLGEDKEWTIDLIDTWEMTVTPYPQKYRGQCRIELPVKPYMALRMRT